MEVTNNYKAMIETAKAQYGDKPFRLTIPLSDQLLILQENEQFSPVTDLFGTPVVFGEMPGFEEIN